MVVIAGRVVVLGDERELFVDDKETCDDAEQPEEPREAR